MNNGVRDPAAMRDRLAAAARLPLGDDDAPYVAVVQSDFVIGDGWDDLLTAALSSHPQYRASEPLWGLVPDDSPFRPALPAGETFALRWRTAFIGLAQNGAAVDTPLAPLRVVRRSELAAAATGPAWVAFAAYAEPADVRL